MGRAVSGAGGAVGVGGAVLGGAGGVVAGGVVITAVGVGGGGVVGVGAAPGIELKVRFWVKINSVGLLEP